MHITYQRHWTVLKWKYTNCSPVLRWCGRQNTNEIKNTAMQMISGQAKLIQHKRVTSNTIYKTPHR